MNPYFASAMKPLKSQITEKTPLEVLAEEATIYENLKDFCSYEDFRVYFQEVAALTRGLKMEERIIKLKQASSTLKTLTAIRPVLSLKNIDSDAGDELINLTKQAFAKADSMSVVKFEQAMLTINNGCNLLVSKSFPATNSVEIVLSEAA